MSNALWAYATLRYDPGDALVGAAIQLVLTKLEQFNPQVLPEALSLKPLTSGLCWAHASSQLALCCQQRCNRSLSLVALCISRAAPAAAGAAG